MYDRLARSNVVGSGKSIREQKLLIFMRSRAANKSSFGTVFEKVATVKFGGPKPIR